MARDLWSGLVWSGVKRRPKLVIGSSAIFRDCMFDLKSTRVDHQCLCIALASYPSTYLGT